VADRSGEWNPRYTAYAQTHGLGEEAMLEQDRARWPGGKMCGFILWIGWAWQEYEPDAGRRRWAAACPERSAAFDAWLAERAAQGELFGLGDCSDKGCGTATGEWS